MSLGHLEESWRRGLRPEAQSRVSEWADQYRILPATSAEPGRWKTSRTEYLREVMDCLSVSNPVERVILQKGAQLGATECGLNFLGFIISSAPGTALFISPTDAASRRNCRLRIDPMIDATPELAARVTRRRSRQAGNSESMKVFPGGTLFLIGANSGVGLRSTPARYVILDEIDAYPASADNEGDPVSLAAARTQTFRGRKKIFMTSTPTIEGASRIAAAYAEGDQRKYHVPCPFCHTAQVLEWCQISWPGDDRSKAFYVCEFCGESIHEHHKPAMIAAGKWIAAAEGDGRTASFHLSGLLSPFVTWAEIAMEHKACGNDPARLQTWFNCSLGEVWQDKAGGVNVTVNDLMARASSWGPDIPDPVVVLTCGADIHLNRIELEITGWCRGEESYSLEYHVVPGSPGDPDTWRRFDELLLQKRRIASWAI